MRKTTIILIINLFLLSFIAYAQKNTQISIQKVPALPALEGKLMAGAAMTDITPPPNIASGARSLTGKKKMKGFRTRLKARTICIRDEAGTSIALVQLDLMFGSLLMHHQIAERIAQETDIPLSNIVLTCTHTHSGPTHYCSNNFYNTYAGAASGFDPTLHEFLTSQIVESILTAHRNMRPAKIATGSIEIRGMTRNRAIEAYIKNEGKEMLDINDPKLIFEAINPVMNMIRIDAKDDDRTYKPLAAFTTFSIHGTAVGDRVDVFNADVFAYAQRELEWNIREMYQTTWQPVHAFCNGTEGDIAPNLPIYKKNGKETKRVPVDFPAVQKIGQGISKKAWELFEQLEPKLKPSIAINVAAKEIDITQNNKIDSICICEKANIGVATLGGAYENRSGATYITGKHSFMMRKKWYGKNRCQGNKRLFLPTIFKLKDGADAYPKNVMFQLIQIDDFLLVPLPWEVTITAGERFTEKIVQAYEQNEVTPPQYVAITSLANDYMSYATTPEEFSLQNYEGGQTIYGKNTVPYIAAQLHALTDTFLQQGQISSFPDEWQTNLKTKYRWPEAKISIEEREMVSPPKFIGIDAYDSKLEAHWYIYWKDVFPYQINMHEPIITIETSHDQIQWKPFKYGIQPIDDEGYDIEVRLIEEKKSYAIYAAKWYNPVSEKNKWSWYRFKIEPRKEGQGILYSAPFRF